MYSRTIKVYQGIDNPLQIVIKNQDQKPLNVSGYDVQLDIQDPIERTSVASFAVIMGNSVKGLGSVIIPRDIVNALEARIYKLTVKLIAPGTLAERPLYIDDNYGAQVDLEVLPGWYESMPLTLDADEVLDAGEIKP